MARANGMNEREDFVAAGDLSLHYHDWDPGSAQHTLVALHGTSMHGAGWRGLANSLMPDIRTIGLDMRAHGDSDAAPLGQYGVMDYCGDLERAVDELALDRFSLIGSSVGSQVALAYSARHPDRVARLVLSDVSFECPVETIEAYIHRHRTRPRIFDDFDSALVYSRQLEQRSRFTEEMHREIVSGDLRKLDDGRYEWRYRLEPIVETLQKVPCDQWDDVSNCQVPTLLLRGSDSNVLLAATAERIERDLADGRVVLIEDSGHMIWTDQPEQLARLTREFILG